MFPEWLTDRGAAVSFGVVAAVLLLAVGPVACALRTPAAVVDEVWWWGGGVFLVVARVLSLALVAPALVIDPMVLVRFADDLSPVPGALAVLLVTAWRIRGRVEAPAAWAAAVVGLTLAAAAYDLACPLREACHGVPASGPLAFPMHGLTEARLATPFIEGVWLLAVLAGAVRLLDRWDALRVGWALLAAVAGTRLVFMPLTAGGVEALDAALLAVAVVASVIAVVWAGRRGGAPAPG